MKFLAIVALLTVAFSGAEAKCPRRAVEINHPMTGNYDGVRDCDKNRSRQEAIAACHAQSKKVEVEYNDAVVVNFDRLTNFGQADRQWRDRNTKELKCRGSWSANCQMCMTVKFPERE